MISLFANKGIKLGLLEERTERLKKSHAWSVENDDISAVIDWEI